MSISSLSGLRLFSIRWQVGALAVVLVFAGLTALCAPFIIDDAFISFRYAENLAHGQGLVYNPGEYVEGFSNFLWVILLAGVATLGGEPLAWSRLFSIGANLLTLILVSRAVRRWWQPTPLYSLRPWRIIDCDPTPAKIGDTHAWPISGFPRSISPPGTRPSPARSCLWCSTTAGERRSAIFPP